MNEQSTNAPAPSKHIFVHELRKQPRGSKVRFLCCVFEYETAKGRLYVEHAYPRDTVPTPRACIDVNLVLETVSSQLLQNGNWINIIGYVQGGPEIRGKSKKTRPGTWHAYSEPEVQGVLIWDASNIRVEDYQITLEEQRRVQSQIRHLHET